MMIKKKMRQQSQLERFKEISKSLLIKLRKCACQHQTVNMVAFFLRIMKIPTQKGDHSCKCTELFLKQNKKNCWKRGAYCFFTIASTGTDGGLDFGTIKVMDEVKQTCTLKNKGKYDIAFK